MKTSGRRKSPSAHMQARGDTEGRDAVEGGEGMKSTRRFKAALAAVLVLALSPLFGGAAFAEDSLAAAYSGNKTAVTDPSTIWDWQGLVENDTSSVGRIWTDKTVSDNEISKNGVTVSKANGADFVTALTALSSTSNLSDTATTPLDIVLVLDASGSMNDPMGGELVHRRDRQAERDGQGCRQAASGRYREVRRQQDRQGWQRQVSR